MVMLEQRVIVGEGGRLVIPSAYRKELNMKPGDEFVISLENGELRLFRQKQALQRLRQLTKNAKTKSKHVTDDFLAFRKQDSREEN